MSMSSRVRPLNVTHVQPIPATDPSPQRADHTIKLSFFDTLFIAFTPIPIQRLFFYQSDDLPPFPVLSRSLQSSLAAALAVFTPLAGRLSVSSSGDIVIDCSPGAASAGVRFTEAEYGGGADAMRRLAGDAEHDVEAFRQLVPALPVSPLPVGTLAVQVTRPADGDGVVAVGVSVHHAVADGQALWQFLRAWAAAAQHGSPAWSTGLAPPTFDRAAINQHPKAAAEALKFMDIYAPALPAVKLFPYPDVTIQRRRTYLLGANQIRSLKRRIWLQSNGGTDASSELAAGVEADGPTTFTAVASLVWTSIVRAKSSQEHNDDDDEYLMFAGDCRARLRPPLPDTFFGNCAKSCFARATVGGLRGDGALALAAAAVREAVRAHLEDPLRDAEQWLQQRQALPRAKITQIGASHRFQAYEADFGWGAPSRVELVSVFVTGFVAVVGAPGGAVQVSVALERERIDAFDAIFLSLSHAAE